MMITKALTREIHELIQEFASTPGPDPFNLRKRAAEFQVLPLFSDWNGTFAIRANGEIVSFTFDDKSSLRTETDPRVINIVIYQGGKKFPVLLELIPEKPDNAQICPYCEGSGIDIMQTSLPEWTRKETIVCYCGGLGWIP